MGAELAGTLDRVVSTLALAAMEQALGVERLKDLTKVTDVAEHGDELAHGNLCMA